MGGFKSAKGVQIREGGPNPRRGSKSASGFGPGGPNPRGVQIRCDTGVTVDLDPPGPYCKLIS